MRLQWEEARHGMQRGFSEDGHQLAQVAQVFSASGVEYGWMVWLTHQQGELFDHYPIAEKARAAAEAALDPL